MNRPYPSSHAIRGFWMLAAVILAALVASPSGFAADNWPSGTMVVPQGGVEPGIDGQTGELIYQLEPANAPFPTKTNESAQAPIYFPLYPLNSAVPANELNCQPTNCDHLSVLPFADANYGSLAGNALACQDFNGGNPCSEVEGHDHLRGVSSRSNHSTSHWAVYLVVFTTQGFQDGAIDNRITTISQLYSLVTSGDVVILPTGLTVTLSKVSAESYKLGTPYQVTYP
jgi:hypothetical protein